MFLSRGKPQKRTVAVGLDLGTSQIKGVAVNREGSQWILSNFSVRRIPSANGKPAAAKDLGEQLQQVMGELGVQDRRAFVTISCSSAVVAQAEFPRMPLKDVRSALKLNSARYLRRDFSNYLIDAVELPDSGAAGKDKKAAKMSILVGGASREDVAWYREALTEAKIRPEIIELAAVSVVNAFQVSQPELCENEVVLLVDIGAYSSTINFLRCGQPLITRIIPVAGHQVSEYVGQMLTLPIDGAEEEKLKMSETVQSLVRTALGPLAREIRSSIDFFERQHECHVTKALACGGSACSAPMLAFLSEDVGFPIVSWNPVERFEMSHLNGSQERLATLAPGLAAAIGVAAGRLN